MSAIDERYTKDFGLKNYDSALHSLWEDKCTGHIPNWPPTLDQVKQRCNQLDEADLYANERR